MQEYDCALQHLETATVKRTMAAPWQAVALAKSEKRRELKLGKDFKQLIEEKGLDPHVYQLTSLNFLEISNASLAVLSHELGNLSNLTNLALQGNLLKTLPDCIGKLTKLKFLDLSHNKLETIPGGISNLAELQSLNVLMNELTEFPDVSGLKALHIFHVSHNKLTALPPGISDEGLVHLSEIVANNNNITTLPSDLCNLPHLNVLNLADNQIEELPDELSECPKLKELKLSGNKIKDRRLVKFTEQNSLKQIMQYLATSLQKLSSAEGDGKAEKKTKPRKKSKKASKDAEEVPKNVVKVLHFPTTDGLVVKVESKVAVVRPYIVCCVFQNLDFFQSNNMFKNFITKQTKIHEEVCQKRTAATIATHDLSLVKGPLVYTSRPPHDIMITPLFKSKETSAADYYKSMQQEAEALRKEKKRSTVSGIHKYLDLLKGKEEFPCLVDAHGHAISLPPLTNSDKTKISRETRHVLVEVTSSVSLEMCKKVMEELIKRTLEMGVGEPLEDCSGSPDDAGAVTTEDDEVVFSSTRKQLMVLQVRVEDEEGGLKVVYPSRADLNADDYEVQRE